MAADGSNRYVVSVLLRDRVGILRDVSTAMTDMGANIDAVSQTVVDGYFTLTLTATFASPRSADDIRKGIMDGFRPGGGAIQVIPYDSTSRGRSPCQGSRYVITMSGNDSPGILKSVTTFLAEKEINLEDWYVQYDRPQVTHIGEITVPDHLDIKQLQDELGRVMTAHRMATSIQHENIFLATNEVRGVQPLLTGGTRA